MGEFPEQTGVGTNPSGVDLRSKSGVIILTIHPLKMSVPDQGTTRKVGR